jgi:hypothetical protein
MVRQYVHFDEREDVLASLEMFAAIVPLLKKKPQFWKWAIVGSHSALQGAFVCYLGGTSGIEVLDEKSAKKWHKWYETMEGVPPPERMANFNTLLKRCCKKLKAAGLTNVATHKQIRNVVRLHRDFRNNFAHFRPMGWTIEKAGLPRIVGIAADFTGHLMLNDDVSYKLNGTQRRRLTDSLKAIKEGLPRSV